MAIVRFGIVGLGNMGMGHVSAFASHKNAVLTACCDASSERLEKLPAEIKRFTDYGQMIGSGEIDAVIVAVPHYAHVPMSIAAMEKGLHVLCEKPIAVSVKAARELNAVAARHPNLAFGIVLQQRNDFDSTHPCIPFLPICLSMRVKANHREAAAPGHRATALNCSGTPSAGLGSGTHSRRGA